MYKDSHVHTTISHDGKSSMDEFIKSATQKGVDEITFTEHYDVYDGLQSTLKTLNVQNYLETYVKMKEIYDFKFNFGIEIGLQPDIKPNIDNLVKTYGFDFIIGSSHITTKKDISKDSSFFEGLSYKEAYLKYFEEVLLNIKVHNNFDVYGHLDYVVRYGGYNIKSIDYKDFSEVLDAILKLLIKKGKGIELNTSGLRYGLPYPHPNVEILKRYKELGGQIITLGSDAHQVSDLASNFNLAYELLHSVGFKHIAVFHNRIPDFIRI